MSLAVPQEEKQAFLDAARALQASSRLQQNSTPIDTDENYSESAASVYSHPVAKVKVASDNTPFVGRNNEYGLLIGLVARLTAGTGYTVLIEGEPGIGKSRLMREVEHYAHTQNMSSLATNCYEIERAMPYQPVIDLVTRSLGRVSSASLRTLAPVSLAELTALVPEVGEYFPDLPKLSNDFPEARQARLFRAVDQFLDATRDGRPAILMVDNIQWADEASAQVLHYLARQTAQRPVLVIYSYRDDAVNSDERFAQLCAWCSRDPAQRDPCWTGTGEFSIGCRRPDRAGCSKSGLAGRSCYPPANPKIRLQWSVAYCHC